MTTRVVVLSAHPWHGPFRLGCHHLALTAARRGADVLYISAPLSSIHIPAALASARTRARLDEMRRGCFEVPVENGRLRALTPFSLPPLSARLGANSDVMLNSWPALTIPRLPRHLEDLGFWRPDLALFDGPLQAALLPVLSPERSVLRMFDRFTHMVGATPALIRAAQRLADAGAWVAYSAYDLERDARALAGDRTIHLPNGVDARAFANPAPIPHEYAAIPGPRAVYVGQTGPLFDIDLIASCAARATYIQFVIIGPTEDRIAAVARCHANIHVLGSRSWESLPGFLQHADIGLVPFDVEGAPDYVAAINPLKIYEFLAAGLPCLATRWAELERLQSPDVHLALRTQFADALERTLAAPRDPARCRGFAASASWDLRFDGLAARVGLSLPDETSAH